MRDLGLRIWAWKHTSAWHAGHDTDDGWTAIIEALETWHHGQGTRGALRIALRHAFTAWAPAEGLSQQEVADRLGEGLRSVGRDVATLKLVFGYGRAAA